jgi:hypothetical protein
MLLSLPSAFWKAAKDGVSGLELEAYLERYPEGEFVELAEARLASLHETATGAPAPNEEVTEGELTFWNSTTNGPPILGERWRFRRRAKPSLPRRGPLTSCATASVI